MLAIVTFLLAFTGTSSREKIIVFWAMIARITPPLPLSTILTKISKSSWYTLTLGKLAVNAFIRCRQVCTTCCILASGMLEHGERMRKCRGNGERIRKWRENEEMERFTLYISLFSLYFLPLYPFPISKIATFCRKMLNMALLSRMSQKT